MTNREDALADAWHRLADEFVKAVRVNHQLINQLSQAGLLPSPMATALTASTDQLRAEVAELRHRNPPDHGLPIRQSDW